MRAKGAKRFKLVVFDWDGTIVDSTGVIAESIRLASADIGYPLREPSVATYVIGLGLRDALSIAIPHLPESKYEALSDRYRFHFLLREPRIEIFPGIERMLRRMDADGHRLAVATGKSAAGLRRSLESTSLHRYFHVTRCADQANPKPAPDMLLQIINEVGVASEETLMVGDTTHDLEMAHNAGVECVAVTYGAHYQAELEQFHPLVCLESAGELDEWLKHNA
jgi:phosphoglycolate phosphatase